MQVKINKDVTLNVTLTGEELEVLSDIIRDGLNHRYIWGLISKAKSTATEDRVTKFLSNLLDHFPDQDDIEEQIDLMIHEIKAYIEKNKKSKLSNKKG